MAQRSPYAPVRSAGRAHEPVIALIVLFSCFCFLFSGRGLAGAPLLLFEIKRFVIEGNTLFDENEMAQVVQPYVGDDKSADDVEAAREKLEKHYHAKGYPAVIVNIPEQHVDDGEIELAVIESKIRRVRVTGNRYFTMEKILDDLPSIQPGKILYVPDIQKELAQLNANRDLKVAPVLMPGKEVGTIDIELKVKDRLPLHGSVEVNNRSSHDTTDLRVNARMSYDNLWQKGHSVSMQYQTAPADTAEVQSVSASYMMPAPWNKDHMFILYGLWSDSDIAFGEGFNILGKGQVFGFRNIIPLPGLDNYFHHVSMGADYKNFDDTTNFINGELVSQTPITYAPIVFSYQGTMNDATGYTQFSAGLNFLFRGLASDTEEFAMKRYKSRANYLYFTAGVERYQDLPFGLNLYLKADGQLSDQPLISNEQYIAGGMESVRGYKESEAVGDDAIHGTVELSLPKLVTLFDKAGGFSATPYLFYDAALLKIQDPLAGQEEEITLQGAGAGIRGNITRYMTYEVDFGIALSDTNTTKSEDTLSHFKFKMEF